jgi:hypothetical protein
MERVPPVMQEMIHMQHCESGDDPKDQSLGETSFPSFYAMTTTWQGK